MDPQGAPDAARSWLCPEPGDRVRVLDMEGRLQPLRRAAFGAMTVAVVACGHWVGWWTLIPLVIAVGGFALVERRIATSLRPERAIAGAWLMSELVIAGSIALSGGPRSAALPWLVIPLVTLPARFTGRALAAGVLTASALLALVTLGVDAAYVAAHPQSLIMPMALMAAVGLLSSALMRSDLEHRTSSVIDPLTGMLNRHALQSRTSELAQQAAVLREPVALIVGDLDCFKAVNDGHGHATGDIVLRQVAHRLRRALRAYDLAYRLGGEEFLVVLPGAGLPQAVEVAEGLRQAIAAEPIADLLVTISFGVSASAPGTFEYGEVFAQADLALYRAKQEGRNRVRAHEDLELGPRLAAA